jgi:hypothetical protein
VDSIGCRKTKEVPNHGKERPTVNCMESYIRDRHDGAHQRRCEAEAKMLVALDETEDTATEVAAATITRASARWCDEPVTGIDHEGLDPVQALWRARGTARLDAFTVHADRIAR